MLTKVERVVEDVAMWVKGKVDGRRIVSAREVAKWRDLDVHEQNRRNREHLDKHVITWDRIVHKPLPLGRPGKSPFIFMHIPKAAGSTFDNVVPKNYDINGVVHINAPHFHKNPGALFKEGRFPRAAMGHYKFNQYVYQLLDSPFVHVTILREPVARVVSYYNFLLAAKKHGRHQAALASTFMDFVESGSNHECHNGQALRIAGLLNRRFVRKPPKQEDALALAKENLLHRFTMFGLTERYAEFMLMCRSLLGWTNLYYSKRKVTRDTPNRISRKDLTESQVNRIRELNQVDIELYDWAAQIVDERCRQLGVTAEMAEEFQRRNDEYDTLIHRPYFGAKR